METFNKIEKLLADIQKDISSAIKLDFRAYKALKDNLIKVLCLAYDKGQGLPPEELLNAMDEVRNAMQKEDNAIYNPIMNRVLEEELKTKEEQQKQNEKNLEIILKGIGFTADTQEDGSIRWVSKKGKMLPKNFNPAERIDHSFILEEIILNFANDDIMNYYAQRGIKNAFEDEVKIKIFGVMHMSPLNRFKAALELSEEIERQRMTVKTHQPEIHSS